MNTQRIALDVSKRAECQPTLTLRQGDRNGTTLEVAITDNGEAMALAGYTVRLCMRLPDNEHYYSVDGTASGSIASFPIDETYAAAYPGRTDEAYIEVLYGEQIICSTHRFAVEIEPGAREGVEPGEMHLAEIDAVIAEVEALIDEIQEGAVFGVKGNAEETYRTGSVNLTPANIGAAEAVHAHAIADVNGLQDALDAKLDDLDVSVTQTATGADITVNGNTVSIANGTDGSDGADGYSPSASVERIQTGATITIEDADGVTSATVYDGTNGRDGADGRNGSDGTDGITPEVEVTPITGGHNVAFDYGTGDPRNRDFDVMDGSVTGVKGHLEDAYRHGDVSLAPSDIGAISAYSTTMSGSDLNDQVAGEDWWGNNFANAPTTGFYRVIKYGAVQIAVGFIGNAAAPTMYVRSTVNGMYQPWMKCLDATGDTMTGDLNIQRNNIDRDGENPSGNQWYTIANATDKDGETIGLIQGVRRTSGRIDSMLMAYNEKTDGTQVECRIQLGVDREGNRTYWVSDAAAFRVAIGSPGAISANGYYGLTRPDGNTTDYLRAPQNGLIPYQSGGSGYLGTSSWPWNYIYGKNIYQNGTKVSVEGHTHSYLPLTGGVLSGGVDVKRSNVNMKASNNGVTDEAWFHTFRDKDTNGYNIGYLGTYANPNGTMGFEIHAYNRNTSGTQVAHNYLNLRTDKSGNSTYSVANAANFRSAIGAAASSDRRLKSDISPLGEDAVEFVDGLEPCVYTINGERQVGLIAQDVHDADPWDTRMAFETREGIDGLDDWEKMDDGSPTWKLDYIRIIPPLVAAVQSANRRIESLEAEVAELKALVAELTIAEK